ncbi:hypothetical protein POVWA1_028850 [Plasmodium ovale wallikeri]|uniref:Uncharacterized protein n=1 Tax=Plasmodium ovale wallikeri TaxID=864142 RepID=A0A1A8YWA3_PLAOA|nr:hypothetical protein POVWA1_028850 [Plasmodium ovale wallikeri]
MHRPCARERTEETQSNWKKEKKKKSSWISRIEKKKKKKSSKKNPQIGHYRWGEIWCFLFHPFATLLTVLPLQGTQ